VENLPWTNGQKTTLRVERCGTVLNKCKTSHKNLAVANTLAYLATASVKTTKERTFSNIRNLEGGRTVPLMEDGVLDVGGDDSGCDGCPIPPGPPGLTMADEEALEGELTDADRPSWPPGEGCDLIAKLLNFFFFLSK
jgi:hypothetical protein